METRCTSKSPSHHPTPGSHSPSRRDALGLVDSKHRASAYATLKGYYHAVFALIRGDSHRPRLPLELVVYIFRFAGLPLPYPDRDLSSLLVWRPLVRKWPKCGTGLMSSSPVLVPLLKTAPITENALRDINRVEVIVNFASNTQYYVSAFPAICRTRNVCLLN